MLIETGLKSLGSESQEKRHTIDNGNDIEQYNTPKLIGCEQDLPPKGFLSCKWFQTHI